MSKVNTKHIVRLVLEVILYKRPTSIPIIMVLGNLAHLKTPKIQDDDISFIWPNHILTCGRY